MVRHAFFSFHYQNDVWRSNVVRNSEALQEGVDVTFFDGVEREEVKSEDAEEIKNWINDQLRQTSVTAILIGEETADRQFVQYEIERSIERGNGLVGVRLHDLPNQDGMTSEPGPNPLDEFVIKRDEEWIQLSEIFETYQFEEENGYGDLGDWLDEGAKLSEDLTPAERQSVRHVDEVPEVHDSETLRTESPDQIQATSNSNNPTFGEFVVGGTAIGLIIMGARVIIEVLQGKSLQEAVDDLFEDIGQLLRDDSSDSKGLESNNPSIKTRDSSDFYR